MLILDTLSQKKIQPAKSKKGVVKIFVCGPTVYDLSHIGHARTYVVFDAFVRYMRFSGLKVFYLQNITDIDDKIIKRAMEQKIPAAALARKFEKEYLKDSKALKITSVNKYARATNHLKEIKKQISTLIAKKFAYQTKNGVYFEINKFKDYGKLSGKKTGELRPGYRIEPDPEKKDPLDFALWKTWHFDDAAPRSNKSKTPLKTIGGEPLWSSPWGWGRPGWHIEDTAITEKYFGSQYDIHGGADELKFPHHEAEIAQQESASGKKPLVKIWMHTGILSVRGEKMSKSLGNFITIKDFLKKYSAEVLRFLILSHQYRSPVHYTEGLAKQASESIKAVFESIAKLKMVKKKGKGKIKIKISGYEKNFSRAVENDFNTARAIAVIFSFISEINSKIWLLNPKSAANAEKFIKEKLGIFGIKINKLKIPRKIELLAKKREQFRANKQFIQSDLLRKKIEMLGYSLEDTPLGPFIKSTK